MKNHFLQSIRSFDSHYFESSQLVLFVNLKLGKLIFETCGQRFVSEKIIQILKYKLIKEIKKFIKNKKNK
jgi:hypothetical protein